MGKAGPIFSNLDDRNKVKTLFYFENPGIRLDIPKLL